MFLIFVLISIQLRIDFCNVSFISLGDEIEDDCFGIFSPLKHSKWLLSSCKFFFLKKESKYILLFSCNYFVCISSGGPLDTSESAHVSSPVLFLYLYFLVTKLQLRYNEQWRVSKITVCYISATVNSEEFQRLLYAASPLQSTV